MTKCINCGKNTPNPKFCSRNCSAQTNNRLFPKRPTKARCTICGNRVKRHGYTLCSIHWLEYKENQFRKLTIGYYRNKLSVKDKHRSWLHVHIRAFARSWHAALLKKPCAKCGYTLHVELCHIKAVSSFPDSALLEEVNAATNIIQLCPNCHWELDHSTPDRT